MAGRAERTSKAAGAPAQGAAFPALPTVSHAALLQDGSDAAFRDTVYLMVLAFGRLLTCREAFGRSVGLTGSQFAVLMGTANRQGDAGVTIRELADHVHLAATHVTTDVGRLIRKGLLAKRPNSADRRSVLVTLAPEGEAAVAKLTPFMRDINDRLFEGVGREDLARVRSFLTRFVRNSDYAMVDLRRREQDDIAAGHPRLLEAGSVPP